ncbi:hypothetical protein Hypma_012980 [Hypsizygus marmoreus]|uniref:Uncharacterized protein n=1 Tax=Hypsizygus marmoreus TaxID=39966 RepID=A0A369JK04_HYPMA|nr:hypothetical protein Hypma_012980 [Hypsizygus marmoreus]
MALNWTMLNPNRSPVPLPNEMTINAVDAGVELSLTIPDAPPAAESTAGGSGGSRRLKALGKIWLTDQRPTFGANYLSFDVKPSPEGGLTDGTRAELRFKDRAMLEFVSLLEKTRERAIYMKRQIPSEDEEGLPIYTSPADSSSVSLSLGFPVDNPPGYNV